MIKSHLLCLLQLLTVLAFGQKYYINEDFNNATLPNGWRNNVSSGTQLWNFGLDGASVHAGNQNINGTAMAYFDDDALGSTSINNTVGLSSPTFNNSIEHYTYLSFDYNFRQYDPINDTFFVEVFDGNLWHRVFVRTINDCGNYTNCNRFPTAFVDISAYANTNCRVRFVYHDGNNWAWYIGLDNVKVWSPYSNDLSISSIISPTSDCGLSIADSIKVIVKNPGYLTQQNFNIAFQLNGSPLVSETITDSLPYQDSIIYTFNTRGNFASYGMHDLVVFTQLQNDSNVINDTLSQLIKNDTVHPLTYFDNFDNKNNWTTAGQHSSWERGIPQNATINSTISGLNAWVTNLDNNYALNELSFLYSPCFDFSSYTRDPIISFYLIHQTELNYDRLWLESSIDNGVSWQKVDSSNLATNWYNNTNQKTWEGNSNGWIKVTNALQNLAGEPKVKLRFVFSSDGSNSYEGIGLDDINVSPRLFYDLSLEKIKHPTDSSQCGYGAAERISIHIKNVGTNPIDSFQVFYQVNNLPIDSEWVYTRIDTLSFKNINTDQTFDFSQQINYTIKTWVKVVGDSNHFNDTLVNYFTNSTNQSSYSIPFSENFDNFNIGAANQNGWDAIPASSNNNSFGWKANTGQTSTINTGPAADHTSGTGNYIYLESSNFGSDGIFESPCINFSSQSDGYILSFWYHRYGSSMQDLVIEYFDGHSWVTVKTISQQAQTSSNSPWTFEEIYLPLSGIITKIRFRANTFCCEGDMALDDIQINPADFYLVNLSKSSVCEVNNQLAIDLMLINKSNHAIASGQLKLSYLINGQQLTQDTLFQTLGSNDSSLFTFNDSIDIKHLSLINTVSIYAEDINPNSNLIDSTDFIIKQSFISEQLKDDFESYNASTLNSNLWNFNGPWLILNDTINFNTSIKNKTYEGFQYLHSSVNGLHDVSFESNCINSREADSLDLVFWYHIQGTPTSKLYILDNSDSNNQIIDSIVGSSPSNQWQRKQLSLDAYLDSTFVLAFRFLDTNLNQNTAVSIDDIQLYEQKSPYDVRVNDYQLSLNNCNYSAKTISISLENLGLDTIPAQAIEVYYQIDQNTAVRDTVQQAIAAGETYFHEFSTSANFSQIGNTYNLRLWSKLNGDLITENDTLITSYTNQTKVDSLYEDFETFTDFACIDNYRDELKHGWFSPNNTWGVHNSSTCLAYPMSGPSFDHTRANGKFIYIEPTNNLNKKAELYSPCIDLSNVNNPVLSYWYHLYGSDIDTFKVEVNLNGQWLTIDSLIGQQQTFAAAAWRHSSIQLNNYKNASPLQFRFSSQIKGRFNRLALDDISIADSLVTSLTQSMADALNYRLYPNPSQGQFTLEVDQSLVGEIFQVRELSGKVVQEGNVHSHSTTIQLDEVAKGIYFLSIPTKNVREKLVVY